MGVTAHGSNAVICSDDTVEKLEASLKALHSRPDSLRRQTRRVIERMRVSEEMMEIIAAKYMPDSILRALAIREARTEAIATLKREKKIR